jgi:hypothetical protein
LTKFTINNYQFETTSVTLFYAISGCHPWLNFNPIEQQDMIDNLDAQEHIIKLHEIHSLIKAKIAFPQAIQQENVDR